MLKGVQARQESDLDRYWRKLRRDDDIWRKLQKVTTNAKGHSPAPERKAACNFCSGLSIRHARSQEDDSQIEQPCELIEKVMSIWCR
jgi:hypothetical protein